MSAPKQIEFGMLPRIPGFDLSEEGSTQHTAAVSEEMLEELICQLEFLFDTLSESNYANKKYRRTLSI